MRKPLFLIVVALALIIGPPGGIFLANAGDVPGNVTWYANSPAGIWPNGGDTGPPLRKFVDSLPGVGPTNANNLGQYIPLAVPDTLTFPGSDYYVIGQQEFVEQMHSDLPLPGTKLRGYVDLTGAGQPIHYLGPLIVAQRDRPVRIKFLNQLAPSPGGQLFVPVDITLMNAGVGPLGPSGGSYTQNRTSIHLHGGFTPWYSDGTPHQWFTPPGETSPYLKGVSFRNIPDMPDPGPGANTMYFPNQQGARFMFYHDHASAITRLNVYAGLAAGYIIHEPVEDDAIAAGLIPGAGMGVYQWGIPLVIQDKTFVPLNIAFQDNQWDTVNWGGHGNLYVPHIYEPNQNINDPITGMNQYGRWDYGPWTQPNILAPVTPQPPALKAAIPLPDGGTPDNLTPWLYKTSTVPEAFNDVMTVNGTVFPYLVVEPKAYRFRILNAANDRALNLQLYLDASGGGSGATATAVLGAVGSPEEGQIVSVTPGAGGIGFQRPPGVNITGGGGFGAVIEPTISGPGGSVTGYVITNPGSGYTSIPTLTVGATTEVKMVDAMPNARYPKTWPKDGRDGGVPDPFTAGPKFIQIGNEGGFLPQISVRDNQPVNYDYDRGSATFGNVQNIEGLDPAIKGTTILLGPAERADVIIDFSTVAPGTNVILYNDAPTPMPGFQPRYDYYTGNPDYTETGGAPQTQVGIGPNTRTIMQFRVQGTPAPAPFDLAALEAAWPNIYMASQPPPIVPQTYYPGAYGAATDTYASINATSLTYKPVGSATTVTKTCGQKAIVEVFEKYGRLQANLGYEQFDPTAIPAISNGVGFKYIDPTYEIFRRPGETQIWKITHNGVDTHPIHIHLVNAQIINRVGWDGVIKPPEPNERGWKETIRMNPLEAIYIALRADMPQVPFRVGPSVRPLNPARPIGDVEDFTNIHPFTGQPLEAIPVVNYIANFGNEYVWHCHILAHEENDMMRPLVMYRSGPMGTLENLLLE